MFGKFVPQLSLFTLANCLSIDKKLYPEDMKMLAEIKDLGNLPEFQWEEEYESCYSWIQF